MKRLAVQLFGHLRTFEHTAESFLKNVVEANIQDGYEVDVFIHTWNQVNTNTITHYNQDGTQIKESDVTNEIAKRVQELYQPKKLLIEPQREHEEFLIETKYGGKYSIKGPFNVTYSMMKSSEIRQEYEKAQNIEYDWVILTRPDVLFETPFRIDDFLSEHTKFNFKLPENAFMYLGCEYARGNKINDPQFIGGCDVIMFAQPENMDIATGFHKNFDENLDIENFICPEYEYYKYWVKAGLMPLAFKYPQQIYIIRENNINLPTETPKKHESFLKKLFHK